MRVKWGWECWCLGLGGDQEVALPSGCVAQGCSAARKKRQMKKTGIGTLHVEAPEGHTAGQGESHLLNL